MEWYRTQSRFRVLYNWYLNQGKGAFIILDKLKHNLLSDKFPTMQRAVEFIHRYFPNDN
jgi:hypothetical protein